MRLALAALFALAVSTSADAQARFVNACIASASAGEEMPFDPDRVCGCAASGAMTAGVDPRDLDRLIDYTQNDDIDVDNLPEAMQATGASVMESLLGCALAEGAGEAFSQAASSMASGSTGATPGSMSTSGVPASSGGQALMGSGTPAIQPPAAPSGLRTGNGGGTVRTSAPSPGAVIRIIG